MKHKLIALAFSTIILIGCQSTRSISNSGYSANNYTGATRYNRELSEMDVLGIDRQTVVSEQDIQDALKKSDGVKLHKGSTILLVQSGAEYPDADMVKQLSSCFNVIPFSGLAPAPAQKTTHTHDWNTPIPVEELNKPERKATESVPIEGPDFSRMLRLAAARSGSEAIVCYWGILESANEGLATKTVSWVPIVSWMIPDERQHMRIRLKIAVLDVRSGAWTMLTPQAFQDDRIATRERRASADQRLVESLKKKSYEAGAKEILQLASNNQSFPASFR